jgi:hypothetical protein
MRVLITMLGLAALILPATARGGESEPSAAELAALQSACGELHKIDKDFQSEKENKTHPVAYGNRLARVNEVDVTACPRDFQDAFMSYREACKQTNEVVKRYNGWGWYLNTTGDWLFRETDMPRKQIDKADAAYTESSNRLSRVALKFGVKLSL